MPAIESTESTESIECTDYAARHLSHWSTILGERPLLGPEVSGRELWPVTAGDGRRYFLKRLGPWRNFPVAEEARVQRYLTGCGVPVAEFQLTDGATVTGGKPDDSFVLMPALPADGAGRRGPVGERAVGRAVAELHLALAAYPWPVGSFTEDPAEPLAGDLVLPPDLLEPLERHLGMLREVWRDLPRQLIHGDLTPGNVLHRGDRVTGIIDLDHLPGGPRVWDLAKYLQFLASRRHPGAVRNPADLLRLIDPFLTGYREAAALTPAELAAVRPAIVCAGILGVDYGRRITTGRLERRWLPEDDEHLRLDTEALRTHLRWLDAAEEDGAATPRG